MEAIKWISLIAPILAAITGWLGRRRVSTWVQSIRAFVDCEGRCLTLNSDLLEAQRSASIARTERDQARQTAESNYQMVQQQGEMIETLLRSGKLVLKAEHEGLLTVSDASPTKSTPSPPDSGRSLPPPASTTTTPSTSPLIRETSDE